MSQATVRATKREIRRAIGPEAIEAIDRIAKAGEGLAQIVANEKTAREDEMRALWMLQRQHAKLLSELRSDRDECYRFLHTQTLWERLRWLVRGT
jgi:hypothetical protein